MKIKYIYLFLMAILISIAVASPLWAVNESVGGAWASLTTGIGARAMGMGGAFVAVADDATAAYWNPAGLGMIDKRELAFMVIEPKHNIYPLTNGFPRTHQYLSGILPIGIGRFGLSGNYFSIGGIQHTEGTSEFDFERYEYFDDKEWALTVSGGMSYPNFQNPDRSWFFLGGNIRVMRQSFFHLSTTGVGGDVGFILRSRKIRLGWVWNVNLSRKWSSDSEEVKVSKSYSDAAVIGWKWGVAFDVKEILTPAFTLTYRQKDAPLTYSAGAELRLTRFFFIRVGLEDVCFNENPFNNSLRAGFGFKLPYLQLDYATGLSENLDTKHRMSMTVRY
ncbi:hypothetical protein FJZ31_21735 [Candidatus Poribacteria bacterium]|nr:hypothetical protein [Candidatus Poribacteria bacterium]